MPDHEKPQRISSTVGFLHIPRYPTAIAEKLAVLEAESLITQRAAQANLDAFKRILDRVPHASPLPGDELPD